ncbi:MAG: hypothetical protein IJ139_05060 [Bacteroidaceae bacterium]|nr:hypothetical protein [Bacteroidaceae bacterium]MBQ9176220.1 hypothetical protein [Bacteroidaceae bacterium]
MKRKLTYIPLLLGCIATMLLSACILDDHPTDEHAQLYIYVYSPNNPVLTRADIGQVDPSEEERRVNKLQIWVFAHEAYTYNGVSHPAGELIGYLEPSGSDLGNINAGVGETYMMEVSEAFASAKPHVDVYVSANVTNANCGITLTAASTPAQLDAANISHATNDFFGMTSPTSTIPTDGLPMSGRLTDQPIYGTSPVFRIGTEGGISTVKLVRAVSKVRFIFTRYKESSERIRITGITLDGSINSDATTSTNHLPATEYLFLDGAYTERSYKVGTSWESGEKSFTIPNGVLDSYGQSDTDPSHPKDINSTEYVNKYVYTTGTGQEYETLINTGIAGSELTEVGPFYLRESDKRIYGTIHYIVGNDDVRTARFSLAEAGDFSRNHTWIVYSYFNGGDLIRVLSVFIKEWGDGGERDHEVYNW